MSNVDNPHDQFPHPEDIWDHIAVAMVRDPKHWTYQNGPEGDVGDCIQLGSGFKNLAGWRNLEYPAWDADWPIPAEGAMPGQLRNFAGSESIASLRFNRPSSWDAATTIRHMVENQDAYPIQPNNSVPEIVSYHTLDHLTPQQVVNTLREVERVLMPGGTFTCILPHGDSQLAKECIFHSSRFMVDTWRNMFSERQYEHGGEWQLKVGMNFIFGITERNTVLCTQLVKEA